MKRLLIASTAILTLASGVSYGLTRPAGVTADQVPPLVAKVENHEVRITDLETKTDDTQTQVNQNTADISAVQDKTGIAPAPKVQAVQTTVAQPQPTTQTVSQTAPEPQPDPRTITSVQDVPGTPSEKNPNPSHTCTYRVVFDNGKYPYVDIREQANPCLQVGDLYPYSIPGMY